jgi:hypothetical protein
MRESGKNVYCFLGFLISKMKKEEIREVF